MAAGALGELVRKLGDRVVQQMVPILRAGMDVPSAATRQGVCYGLKELLDNITRTQLGEHLPALLPTVQAALTDTDPTVRAVRLHSHAVYIVWVNSRLSCFPVPRSHVTLWRLKCCRGGRSQHAACFINLTS